MREIAAYAVAALQNVPSGEIRTTGHVAILDVVVDPLADGHDARPAVLDRAELLPGEVGQLIRVAIPARQRVAKHRRRQFSRRDRRGGGKPEVIGFRRDSYDRVV